MEAESGRISGIQVGPDAIVQDAVHIKKLAGVLR
jgi:hypothetical protein